MFDILCPYMDTAIQNAKKLEALHRGKPPSEYTLNQDASSH